MSQSPLSDTAFLILLGLSLSPSAPQHGYALIQGITHRLGRPALLPAALYTTLPKLIDAQLVQEVPPPPDNTDSRRRYYRLTAAGQQALSTHAQLQAPLAQAILNISGPSGARA